MGTEHFSRRQTFIPLPTPHGLAVDKRQRADSVKDHHTVVTAQQLAKQRMMERIATNGQAE